MKSCTVAITLTESRNWASVVSPPNWAKPSRDLYSFIHEVKSMEKAMPADGSVEKMGPLFVR